MAGASGEKRTGRGHGTGEGLRMSGVLALQVGSVARRSVLRTLRQPLNVVPALGFPLIFFAVNSAGLDAITMLPGFPGGSFVDFFLAFAFLQGATFAVLGSGQDLAQDIQTGFFNRLSLTPLRGVALIAGQLGGVLALGFVQAVVFLGVGIAAGVRLEAGAGGALVLIGLFLLVSIAFGAVGTALALYSGTTETIQGAFPIAVVFLWFSSMYLPRDLIEADWFRTIATINPVSYLIEGIRSLILVGWDAQALALGFGFAAAILVFGLAVSAYALPRRLTRT
jgi:ABC-2 type transport system permease protein